MNREKGKMTCVLCTDALWNGKPLKASKCGHIFHFDCFDDAVKHKISLCPLCKSRMMMRHAGPLHLHPEDIPVMWGNASSSDPVDSAGPQASGLLVESTGSSFNVSPNRSIKNDEANRSEQKCDKTNDDSAVKQDQADPSNETLGDLPNSNLIPLHKQNDDASMANISTIPIMNSMAVSHLFTDVTKDATVEEHVVIHDTSFIDLQSGNENESGILQVGIDESSANNQPIKNQANIATSSDETRVDLGDEKPTTNSVQHVASNKENIAANGQKNQVQPELRIIRANSHARMVPYDRNIRIQRPQRPQIAVPMAVPLGSRSARTVNPVRMFNYCHVFCIVCHRRFSGDFPFEHCNGAVCSLKCLNLMKN